MMRQYTAVKQMFCALNRNIGQKNSAYCQDRMNFFRKDAEIKYNLLKHYIPIPSKPQDNDITLKKRLLGDRPGVIVSDYAGTVTQDSLWPAQAFVQVFKEDANIDITLDEARGPMGRGKFDHFVQLLQSSRIETMWAQKNQGILPTKDDAYRLVERYERLPIPSHEEMKDIIILPGVQECFTQIRMDLNWLISMTTGYDRQLANQFITASAQHGLHFDSTVATNKLEIKNARPHPDGIYRNLKLLGLPHHPKAITDGEVKVIKIDDTSVGVKEGLNAGALSVACYATSTLMNYDYSGQMNDLTPIEWIHRRNMAIKELTKDPNNKPHIIVPTFHYIKIIAYLHHYLDQ
jgi:phosphonoacetaldehyde hydrolase